MICRKTKVMVALFLVFLVSSIFPQTQFLEELGGGYSDAAYSIVEAVDGGYMIAGWTNSYGAGEADLLMVRFDELGNYQWARTLGGDLNDYGWSLVQTAAGDYVIAGVTESFGAGGQDILIVKLSNIGQLQWTKSLGGTGNDHAQALIQTDDGGFAVAGYTTGFGAGSHDVFLVKLDSLGDHQWSRTLGGANYDRATALVQALDGGYVIAGYTSSFGAGSTDVLLAKFDAAGSPTWAVTAGGASDECAYSVIGSADWGYVVAGYTCSFGTDGGDILITKFHGSGYHDWSRTLSCDSMEYALSLVLTKNEGYAVTGAAMISASDYEIILAKFNIFGDFERATTLGRREGEGRAIIATDDLGYAVAGATVTYGGSGLEVLLTKYDASGNSCEGDSIIPSISIVHPDVDSIDPSVFAVWPTVNVLHPTITYPDPTATNICLFVCGDADGNGVVNISDAVYLIAYIFGGGLPPDPLKAGDVDCNDIVNISDVVYMIAYIFGGGQKPCADCP